MIPIDDRENPLLNFGNETAEIIQLSAAAPRVDEGQGLNDQAPKVDSSREISLIEFSSDANSNIDNSDNNDNASVIVEQPRERPRVDAVMSSSFGFSMVPQIAAGSLVNSGFVQNHHHHVGFDDVMNNSGNGKFFSIILYSESALERKNGKKFEIFEFQKNFELHKYFRFQAIRT